MGHATLAIIWRTLQLAKSGFASHLFDTLSIQNAATQALKAMLI